MKLYSLAKYFSPCGTKGISRLLPVSGSIFKSLGGASSCQKIESSFNAFSWWRDRQKERLEWDVTTCLLLCVVAANKGCFSAVQDVCEPKYSDKQQDTL